MESAILAACSEDALGADGGGCVMHPRHLPVKDSMAEPPEAALLLGFRIDTLPNTPAFQTFETMLAPIFADKSADITEETLQSLLRGVNLMALYN